MKRKIRNDKNRRAMARRTRVSLGLAGTDRPQLRVFRSSKHIYAQLIDPATGQTIATASSNTKAAAAEGAGSGKIETAKRIGKAIAEIAREKQIVEVAFNRNGFLYHGRVKALAEAAREAGLRF